MHKIYGGVEIGGTKTICAIGHADGRLLAHKTIPTTSVEETLLAVNRFFEGQAPVAALGVGSFGPLNLHKLSEDYGSIHNSPKPGWTKVDLKTRLGDHFKVPIEFDLDVNCAALGELYFGVAKDVDSFVYLTFGTGVGGSLVINKEIIHGILNLEMGHMRIPYTPSKAFKGVCKYHGDCLEGIASGYAMQQKYGQPAEGIYSEKIWDEEADYIALAINNIIMTVGPQKIVLGGGLTHHSSLIERVRLKLRSTIDNYLSLPNLDTYIVASSGDLNGVLGAIKLSRRS
ncbi:MAG: ROK family protein [Candidatus Saccharimonadales bacterium]